MNKMSKIDREMLIEAVLMCRQGPPKPGKIKKPQPFATYSEIAKALRIPYNTVQHICRYKPIP